MTLILVVCCNLIFLQNASFDAGSRHNGIMQNSFVLIEEYISDSNYFIKVIHTKLKCVKVKLIMFLNYYNLNLHIQAANACQFLKLWS